MASADLFGGSILDFQSRNFLFLQGPHGPFFSQFAGLLDEAGAKVLRVNFNNGDKLYWNKKLPFIDYQGHASEWAKFVEEQFETHNFTDLVTYSDTREIHRQAIEIARARGAYVHVFEEGYLRPYWATYERDGVNGYSPLMALSVDEIRKRRQARVVDLQAAPAIWGSLVHHQFHSFWYHFFLAAGQWRFHNYKGHRNISIWKEVRLNLARFFTRPLSVFKRDWQTQRFLQKGHSFYLVLLQLEHDASLRYHAPFSSQKEMIDEVIESFAKNSAAHLYLVFKLHPLDDGRVPIRKWIEEAGREHNVVNRIRVFSGGKLGHLVNAARGAISANSTSVQQAMWRGLPVKLFGNSVFSKPEFATSQHIDEYFSNPVAPNKSDFLEFRSYLLETSQVAGGFYTQTGRSALLRKVIDLVMDSQHPYDKDEKKI